MNLELATCQQTETFTQPDERSLLWSWLNLGTNTAQVSVPVTYRYHVHLRDFWKLETKETWSSSMPRYYGQPYHRPSIQNT